MSSEVSRSRVRSAHRGLMMCVLIALGVGLTGSSSANSSVETERPKPRGSLIAPAQRQVAEQQARRRATRLQSPRARKRRAASRTKHASLSPARARRLAITEFHAVLRNPVFRGDRGAGRLDRVVRRVDRRNAIVEDRQTGEKLLWQSSLPLETSSGDPVDLGLDASAGAARPVTPLVPLELGVGRVAEARFPDDAFGFRFRGLASKQALIDPKMAFFADVAEATDFIVKPMPLGAEFDVQIRSAQSPEQFFVDLDLPPGARLRRAVTDNPIPGDPPRSLEVYRGDESLAFISPPMALDAAGQHVSVTAEPVGSTIRLDVTHHSKDLEYPILVDPQVVMYGSMYGSTAAEQNFDGWYWTQVLNGGSDGFGFQKNNCAYFCGLYQSMPTHHVFKPGAYATHFFFAPNGSYLARVTLGNYGHYSELEAFGLRFSQIFNGIQNAERTVWEPNTYPLGNPQPTNPFIWGGEFSGGETTYCFGGNTCNTNNGPRNGWVFQALQACCSNGNDITTNDYIATSFTGWTQVYLGDRDAPQMTSSRASAGWSDDGGATHNVSVSASDAGLGVTRFEMTDNGGGLKMNAVGAAGCGNPFRNGCPLDAASGATTSFAYQLAEGVHDMRVRAVDFVGNGSGDQYWQQKIDRSNPTLPQLGGELYDKRNRWISSSSSPALTMSASDSYSGVSSYEVKVDGQPQTVGCTNPCAGTTTWSYPIPADSGWRTLTVASKDAVGRSSAETDVFRIAADHAAPSVTTLSHVGLPDPNSWTLDVESPIKTTVTASDSESGLKTATLSGPGLGNLPKAFASCDDTFSNPCPTGPKDLTFDWDTTAADGSYQIPDGDNTITLTVSDAIDRSTTAGSWHVKLDRGGPDIEFAGDLYTQRSNVQTGTTARTVSAMVTDGSGTGSTARSGVTSVDIYVDGTEVATGDQTCTSGNCTMTKSAGVVPADYMGGTHEVEVIATDALGNTSSKSFDFTTGPCCSDSPATWITDQLAFGSTTTDVAFADVTGDGNADIVSRQRLTGQVQAAISNGSGSFTSRRNWAPTPGWPVPRDFRLGDIDGDGTADLYGRDPVTGQIYVGISNGSIFGAATQRGTAPASDEYYLANISGHQTHGTSLGLDLVTRVNSTATISVAFATGSGWEPIEGVIGSTASDELSFADADGDGIDDVVMYNPTSRAVRVATSQGGSIATPTSWGTATNADPQFADVDGDGSADMISRNSSGQVSVQSSDGTRFLTAKAWGTFDTAYDLFLADVNGDEEADVVGRTSGGAVQARLSRMATPVLRESTFIPDPDVVEDPRDPTTTDATGGIEPAADPVATASAKARKRSGRMRLMWQDDSQLVGTYADRMVSEDRIDQSLTRIKQAGATMVRVVVYWGRWEANATFPNIEGGWPTATTPMPTPTPNYQYAIARAIRKISQAGLTPYVTLTGSNFDSIGGQKTSQFKVDGNGGYDGIPAITPDTFATWVTTVVTALKLEGAHSYGIWNEPNLADNTAVTAGRKFLQVLCNPDSNQSRRLGVHTAGLYRLLYQKGRQAVKDADGSAVVYLGEFSEQKELGRVSCSGGQNDVTVWSTVRYLKEVANSTAAPLRAYGVAWHAYQHSPRPKRHDNFETGVGQTGVMRKAIQELYGKPNQPHALKTPGGAKPGLYITEFGYFNRPNSSKTKKSDWHSEKRRYNWYRGALNKANDENVKVFNIYGLAEITPQDPTASLNATVNFDAFDTGLIDASRDNPTFNIRGQRFYGLKDDGTRIPPYSDPNTPPATGTERRAYCGIRRWAKNHGLTIIANECDSP